METIFELSDILGIIIGVLLALLIAIAIIRTVIKTRRGDHIEVPPVGVMNDLLLPGFVVIWPDGEKFQKSVKICVTKMKYLRLTDEIK